MSTELLNPKTNYYFNSGFKFTGDIVSADNVENYLRKEKGIGSKVFIREGGIEIYHSGSAHEISKIIRLLRYSHDILYMHKDGKDAFFVKPFKTREGNV